MGDELEERLRAELGGEAPPLAPEIDAFLADAGRMAARRLAVRRRRHILVAAAPVLAAAAALALYLVPAHRDPRDVNGDGQVDILDAFAMARGVDARATRPDWDRNGDGLVDRADVELLARAIVRVK